MQVWSQNATLCVICATVLGLGRPCEGLAEGVTAAARASGAERQRAADGWLRLESDQRIDRARASPLTPAESQRLQVIEQQERGRLRGLLQSQQRELQSLSRQERRSQGEVPQGVSPEARLRGRLLEQQRAQRGLALRRQMHRYSQGSPPRGVFGR